MQPTGDGSADVDVAVDNDVILKAACYGLARRIWRVEDGVAVGVLGAARYVVRSRIGRAKLAGDQAQARAHADEFFKSATALEPTEREVELAAELEVQAQRGGLSLDEGESQLVAMVIERAIPVLETGDKRAIRSLERLVDGNAWLEALCTKTRCFEQVVLSLIVDQGVANEIAECICGEPDVDKTMSICCRCYSPPPHGRSVDLDGFASYIRALRKEAPRILAS